MTPYPAIIVIRTKLHWKSKPKRIPPPPPPPIKNEKEKKNAAT